MSHFSVLVIGDDPEGQLAPFHEFECTGEDDQYVQTIDKTAEALAEFEDYTIRRIKLADGTLVDPYEDGAYKQEFLRPATVSELEAIKTDPLNLKGSCPKETKERDGQTYVFSIPDGAEDVQVPAKDHQTFVEFCEYYYGDGRTIESLDQLDLESKHKFGYTLNPPGGPVQVFDRTNPNAKWDWYQTGGRWTGFFKIRKRDVDFEGMREDAKADAAKQWDDVHSVIDAHPPIEPWPVIRDERFPGDIDKARVAYREQAGMVALREADKRIWDVDPFLIPREQFIERAGRRAAIPFAIVKDSQWYERGSMGWWGVSDEKDEDEWHKQANDLIDSLPDDTVLTLVDCHI